jgi:two-component system sensor histidine kinase EvgS
MGQALRVLLVEDSSDDAAMILRQLHRGGFEPSYARVETSQEMSQALQRQGWDIIIADYSLPAFSGPSALRILTRHKLDIPFIVVTGTVSEEVAVLAMKSGAHDCILKANLSRLAPAVTRELADAETRRKATEARRIQEERDHLRQAIAAQEKVLGVVSHELRTPLAAARAMAEFLLTEGARDTNRFDQFLHSIHAEVVRMSSLVNDLLEVARLNSGTARWNWGEVSLQETCESAIASIGALLDGQAVTLAHEVEPGLAMRGDGDALHRMVVNLLSNACRYTASGCITVRASSAADPAGAWVRVEVADTGQGMSPETLALAGQPFALNSGVVGGASAATGGIGLGLSICKGIAAAHGGTLSIHSELGRGTTVTVLLRADLEMPDDDMKAGELNPLRVDAIAGDPTPSRKPALDGHV